MSTRQQSYFSESVHHQQLMLALQFLKPLQWPQGLLQELKDLQHHLLQLQQMLQYQLL